MRVIVRFVIIPEHFSNLLFILVVFVSFLNGVKFHSFNEPFSILFRHRSALDISDVVAGEHFSRHVTFEAKSAVVLGWLSGFEFKIRFFGWFECLEAG